MAQNSAHVTQTLQATPSIFELVAADSFQSTFYPALKRIANFLVNLNPARYGWLSQYYDEVYLGLNGIIQYHYIHNYGGSLAEVFYSLSRVRSKTGQFTSVDKWLAFALVVIVPYVTTKLANLISRWENECADFIYDINEYTLKQKYIKSYKFIKGVHDCFQVVQYVGYLSNRSQTHAILNRVIGQHLVYLPMDTNLEWTWSDLFTMNFRHSAVLTGMVFRALELSAFFLQFIQWWQNETNNGSLTKLPNPEAPTISGKNANAAGKYRNICPVCLQTWKIPTVNRVSGFVFCFKCIAYHLNESSTCPVTKYATSFDDLIRIYEL